MSVLRAFARVHTTDLAATRMGFEALGLSCGPEIPLANGLSLLAAGRTLVVAGSPEALRPFARTQATLIIDNLDQALADATTAGAVMIHEPDLGPTGVSATIAFGDAQLELVEWSSAQWERVKGREAGRTP